MKSRSIKNALFSAIALAAAVFAFTPTSAEAGHTRSAGRCGSCGSGIYQQLVYSGYRDRCGNPVYQWVTVGHTCRHSSHGHSHSSHSHGYSTGYSYSRSPYSGFTGGITIRRYSVPSSRYSCR